MHELAIVESLFEQVNGELDRAGQTGKVVRIELEVGRLSGVCCESLQFAFKLLSAGSRFEDAEIAIKEPRAVCVCKSCGAKTEIDDLVVQCPKCAGGDIFIEGGRKLLLQSIEIED